jgi:glucose/arabinose dehydrogenase
MSKRKVQTQCYFVHLILYSNTQSCMKKAYFILAISLLSFSIFAQPNISLNQVITGLNQPMQFVNAGDGTNRIFIPQKGGEIKVFDRNFASLGTFLTLTPLTEILTDGEQGLLSLCFHPQYKTNGLFFVYYVNTAGDLEIARFKVRGGDTINVANPASKKVVITIPHPTHSNHNGGTLRFGKDGFLYLSTGDGGSGGDPANNSQSNNLLGKMIRINVNTSETPPFYSIPAGNISGTEVLAKGLRNPFRWNFDRLTGDMWIGDVGQGAFEEISRVHRDSMQVNFGWRCYEGFATYNTTDCLPAANYRFPVVALNRSEGQSIVGGTVYRGQTYLSMKGYYFGVDFYTGKLFKIKFDSLTYTYNITSQIISPNTISDFGESEDGEMYVTNLGNGKVYRMVSDGPVLQYIFTGNGNWTDAANWSNNTIPSTTSPSGSVIIINPTTGGECVVNVPITISSGMKIRVENSKLLRMSSNLSFQ